MVETVNIHDIILLLDEIQMDVTADQEPVPIGDTEFPLSDAEMEYYRGCEDILYAIRESLEQMMRGENNRKPDIKGSTNKFTGRKEFNRFSEIDVV